MKTSLILGLILVWSASAHAELRIIGVRVTRDTNSMVHVSISSDDKKEIKKDVTVEQAAGILRDAKGWGSSVVVGIVAHGVRLQEYLPLLKAIADNASLDLAFAEGWKPDGICDNIKKRIEQDTGANTP